MMKKRLLIIALAVLLIATGVLATKWSDYTDQTAGNVDDLDTFLIRDVSDTTLAATGTQKEYPWSVLKTDLESAGFLGSTTTTVNSIAWVGGGMTPDGTQCAAAADVQINSGPYQSTIICTDNDASTLYGNVQMPDGWDAGNLTFELAYIQTAADTGPLNGDVTIQCRGAGETVNNTWESEVAMDDAAVTGSNGVDHLTSGNVSGTCVAGDTVYWRWQMDATGTTTAVATLNFAGMKMEYTDNIGD